MAWSIAVKTLGVRNRTEERQSNADAKGGEVNAETKNTCPSDFTVEVEPEETVSCLHERIEKLTGLQASQQRLIYRGRIISGGVKNAISQEDNSELADEANRTELKMSDVEGLCDGQTIHLVPRITQDIAAEASQTSPDVLSTNPTVVVAETAGGNGTLSGSSTASLLATLLGLGMSGAFSTASDEDGENDEGEGRRQARAAPAFLVNRRSRRPPVRSVAAPRGGIQQRNVSDTATASQNGWPSSWAAVARSGSDPGSLEPVRQGLMTINTMVDHLKQSEGTEKAVLMEKLSREWYKGQWLDCKDTVNQWLEATVVDIARAQDVLTPSELNYEGCENGIIAGASARRQKRKRKSDTSNDPIVGVNDLEGRRQLLLEPCADVSTDAENKESKLRDRNKDVQLLLIHYNGWPHRWDEWIRSDSERITPFRTKTRHNPSAPFASPTPQAVFQAAPTTFLTTSDDGDRHVLLNELHRTLATVTNIFSELESLDNSNKCASAAQSPAKDSLLPWRVKDSDTIAADTSRNNNTEGACNLKRAQLTALAPLLDRLGRTLTDVAPHIAVLANSIPYKEETLEDISSTEVLPDNNCDLDETETGTDSKNDTLANNDNALLSTPLLSSDSVGILSLTSSESPGTSSVLSTDSAGIPPLTSSESPGTSSELSTDSAGIPPLLSPGSVGTSDDSSEAVEDFEDYADCVYGMVNVSRNDIPSPRAGSRSRNPDTSNGSNTSSLLATYLTAAGLGGIATSSGGGSSTGSTEDAGNGSMSTLARLLRAGGNNNGGNGGGIDIHIHAIVTPAPGLALMGGGLAGGLGLMNLPNTATEQAQNSMDATELQSEENVVDHSTSASRLPVDDDDDEFGLFSELYSETPSPSSANHQEANSSARESGIVSGSATFDGNVTQMVSESTVERLSLEQDSTFLDPCLELIDNDDSTSQVITTTLSTVDNSSPARSEVSSTSASSDTRRLERVSLERGSVSSSSSSPREGREQRRVSALSRLLRRALGRRANASGENNPLDID